MEKRSTFRFRLPWSQSEAEPSSKASTQPNTKTTGPSRRTRRTTATSGKPSSAQPSASTQGRNKVPARTTTTLPRSTQPQPQNSAETKAPSQPTTTSTSTLPESNPVPSQPSAESKAPIQSSTTNTKPTDAPASPKSETQTPTTDQLTPKKASPVSQTSSNLPFDITSQMQPKDQTRDITEGPSKISDSSRIISEPKTARPLETNIQETKVKEVVQEIKDKNYGAEEKIGGPLKSKEKPDIVFQSKQASSDDDQIQVNRVSNGKQTRSISSQLKNRTVDSGSKGTAVSAEKDIPFNKEVKDNISKFIHRMTIGDGKQNLEEGPVSVITLAGDNRGASMQLGSKTSKKGEIHINRGYKLNADESVDATTDAEGRQRNDARTMKDQEIEAYMNCNVQGLNNSITFDSSIEENNPGIHMSFPRMPSETIRSSEGTGQFEAHKAEFNVTRSQKHTYEPTIRRSCLEGLFFEPSDSDSDNPDKPQRHGCHVDGMEKRSNEIDIL